MNAGLKYLSHAKRCEIADLHRLASTSDLVEATGQLVHGLQRERGLSNLFLGTEGHSFAGPLRSQQQDCDARIARLRRTLTDSVDDPARAGASARLYSRIAFVLEGLGGLPALREATQARQLTPRLVVAAYVRLIGGLLAMVFEAADAATDPEISRLLVALFHFMQAKEFAGQERAEGVALLAGTVDPVESRAHLTHLIESRERCDRVFVDFATPAQLHLARSIHEAQAVAEQERLRRLLLTARRDDPALQYLGAHWFACCTTTIDTMRVVEERLAADLLVLCQRRIETAEAELQQLDALSTTLLSPPAAAASLAFFGIAPGRPDQPATDADTSARPLLPVAAEGTATRHFGPGLERSILDLVITQTDRLLAMQAELDAARQSLHERKLIERAKGVLMAHRKLSEATAHKTLRQMAMNGNRRLVDVAEAILAVSDVLPGDVSDSQSPRAVAG